MFGVEWKPHSERSSPGKRICPMTNLDRRSFLKLSSAALAAVPHAGRPVLPQGSAAGEMLYSAGFVPEGAECRMAFVSDHHYWPGHLENWGDGSQITTSTDRRMPDLAEALNEERPDLSVHAGDVISAGGSFFPPPEVYARQLAFARGFCDSLSHPTLPLPGNHETLEPEYVDEAQLGAWSRHFGAPYRHHDLKGWRIIGVNCLMPNPNGRHGRGDDFANVYGLDPAQLDWLRSRLNEAALRGLKTVVCTHVPPAGWVNAAAFEAAITSAGCVKAVLCGHTHRNSVGLLGGVPVLVRVANVTSPFGYTMVHFYPDGRMLVIQKSQHFPFEDFISSKMQPSGLGSEADRYLTLGGSSQLPLGRLKIRGADARAEITNGHLRLTGRNERAVVLIDTAELRNARMTVTLVKSGCDRMGGVALAATDGTGGIEAAVTSRYSPDGKVHLAGVRPGGRDVLARSWFNIADNIAYRLVLEVRESRVSASWKNMLNLSASAEPGAAGQFGIFVDRGTIFVTDLKLERL